eukprot:scpid97953/ scgid14905/ 
MVCAGGDQASLLVNCIRCHLQQAFIACTMHIPAAARSHRSCCYDKFTAGWQVYCVGKLIAMAILAIKASCKHVVHVPSHGVHLEQQDSGPSDGSYDQVCNNDKTGSQQLHKTASVASRHFTWRTKMYTITTITGE